MSVRETQPVKIFSINSFNASIHPEDGKAPWYNKSMSEKPQYKKFTPEEDSIYCSTIESIRSGLKNGVKFDLACSRITVRDEELRQLICEDALKIEIAEQHYGSGLPLPDLAKRLGITLERVIKASEEMMEDIFHTADTACLIASEKPEPPVH